MLIKSLLVLPLQMRVLFLVLVFMASCSNDSVKVSVEQPAETSQNPNLTSLDLNRDSFFLSSTHLIQLEVYKSLFLSPNCLYDIPGNLSMDAKEKLFEEIRKGYFAKSVFMDHEIKKYYHNFAHAMDVMVTTHMLLETGGAIFLTQDEQALLLLAALAHDARHTGFMNSFLIKAGHEYAQKFNHESLQEKQSLSFLLGLLESHNLIQSGEDSKIKKFLSEVIIFTDMKRHKEQLQKMNAIMPQILSELKSARGDTDLDSALGSSSKDLKEKIDLSAKLDQNTRFLIASFLLHCADISNPGKDWEESERWAILVLHEFFQQGDFEKQKGMEISMNCSREKSSIPESQLGFGKYIIKELYDILLQLNHEAGSQFQKNFEANQLKWTKLREEEKRSGVPYLPHPRPPSSDAGWNGKG